MIKIDIRVVSVELFSKLYHVNADVFSAITNAKFSDLDYFKSVLRPTTLILNIEENIISLFFNTLEYESEKFFLDLISKALNSFIKDEHIYDFSYSFDRT